MNFIQFITTRKFLKHFGSSLLITVVLVWITLLLLKQYTKHGATVDVPSFIGQSILNIPSYPDLDIMVVDSVYDYDQKPGTIISQDPQPLSKVKPGRTIYLSVIAFVPEKVKMPALVDLSLRQAKALLQTYGLKLGYVKTIPDPAKNAVLQVSVRGKTIQPGTMIPKGSTIDLIIGSGEGGSDVQVPFLIGKNRNEAISEITRLGLIIGNELFGGSSDSNNARVYLQTPMHVYGMNIPLSTSVDLTYRTDDDLDFSDYIMSLEIDTIQPVEKED
jgi:eukaryotic-like serine/threonine-protein kinase